MCKTNDMGFGVGFRLEKSRLGSFMSIMEFVKANEMEHLLSCLKLFLRSFSFGAEVGPSTVRQMAE